jgi:hypothetical protein
MGWLEQKTNYTLLLSVEEMRLVSKALGGRLRPEDVEPAKALDRELAIQRVKQAQHLALEMRKLEENLKKEEESK